jgi:hypothetical protein
METRRNADKFILKSRNIMMSKNPECSQAKGRSTLTKQILHYKHGTHFGYAAWFGWPLSLKFFAGKDRQDGQYDKHGDLIGKGDGQEIVRYAYYQRCKTHPHQVATPRNKFGHHKDEPKREPEPMR